MTEPTKTLAIQTVLDEVATNIKNSGDDVRKRLIAKLTEDEVSERVDLMTKAIQKRFQQMNDLKKVDRPDQEFYEAEGDKPAQAFYTKARKEEIKKAKEALQKTDNAIEKALDGDWTKLKELLK